MKDQLDEIVKHFENKFDIEEPTIGHFNRFKSKLNNAEIPNKKFRFKSSSIAIAASIVLLIGVWIGAAFSNTRMELASISPEMEETQSYFLTTIKNELETIENKRNSDTEQLINDSLSQLKKLEKQYNTLTLELKESTEDKRIIYAMISNFQQRINVLQNLLIQIDIIKQLKIENNEKYT
ncbi:hypothetical protein [Lutibacter sp.]